MHSLSWPMRCCAPRGPVRTLVDLSLAPEHRRGHGALYDGLNQGTMEIARLRRCVAGLPLPRVRDRIVLAADVSPWLRPDCRRHVKTDPCEAREFQCPSQHLDR
jgi:hypothetical protein